MPEVEIVVVPVQVRVKPRSLQISEIFICFKLLFLAKGGKEGKKINAGADASVFSSPDGSAVDLSLLEREKCLGAVGINKKGSKFWLGAFFVDFRLTMV